MPAYSARSRHSSAGNGHGFVTERPRLRHNHSSPILQPTNVLRLVLGTRQGADRQPGGGGPVLLARGRRECVRAMVAFLTNDSAARVRGRLVITEAPVQYTPAPQVEHHRRGPSTKMSIAITTGSFPTSLTFTVRCHVVE